MPRTSEGQLVHMLQIFECDRNAIAAALRCVNMVRDSRDLRLNAGRPPVGGWDAVAINLDRIREDFDNASDDEQSAQEEREVAELAARFPVPEGER